MAKTSLEIPQLKWLKPPSSWAFPGRQSGAETGAELENTTTGRTLPLQMVKLSPAEVKDTDQ